MKESSSKQVIGEALDSLNKRREAWAGMSLDQRIEIAERLRHDLFACSDAWVEASVKAKGVTDSVAGRGQEWQAGPAATLRNLRLLGEALRDIRAQGHPRVPGPVTTRPDGQVIARVFPAGFFDKLFFPGTSAEVWMGAGVTPENLHQNMAAAYRGPPKKARICLVLGGGNVSSIAPMDCFYKLFVEKKLVILKMHPVNDYLGPIFEKGFAALIEKGFLTIVYGAGDVGAFLCTHDQVDEIHITGSDKTHDLIVFGPEPEKQKAARRPINPRPITSELGNVSPVIVVPGPWSPSDLSYQAENVVSSLANNAGFNCNASRVLITQRGWPLREAFLDKIRERLRHVATRDAYYPGSAERFAAFKAAHPEGEAFGNAAEGHLPWMLIPGLDPDKADEICFRQEAFCGIFAETALQADSIEGFLSKAVQFSNDTLWGTLNATLIIHPKTSALPDMAGALDKGIAELRFGTVSINHWAAIGYVLSCTTWGAFPGHDIYDIRSGKDVVHNALMFDRPQKSVVHGPFRASPKPAWFISNRRAPQIGRKLTAFEANPSPLSLPGMVINALRG